MQFRKKSLFILAALLLLVAPFVIKAQQPATGDNPSPAVPLADAATPSSLEQLLPDKLAGMKSASDVKQYARDNLAELVADKAAVYQEYLVTRAVSRQYAEARVDIFETANPFAAFGLFTYSFGPAGGKAVSEEIGSGAARIEGGLVFWKDNYFVRVANANRQKINAQGAAHPLPAHTSLARAIAAEISPNVARVARPPLLESLPPGPGVAASERYFLGPESLDAYLERGREMFGFAGDAEAVMAEYPVDDTANGGARVDASPGPAASPRGQLTQDGRAATQEQRPPLKLVIVEYHTPQFAYDAMARLNEYIATLPEGEQNRIIAKREGNYIVEAVNVEDRDSAQALVEAVKYPYGVKWLRDPRLPSNDPFRIQKAAQMLISTFTLLGLLLLTVLAGGGLVGTMIF
ncbi:MAG TPA: DUF6599 family protein, partial [Blastocatellia bacterium]|nr:DUF6599 family protein [Blastocatellia bacterium]